MKYSTFEKDNITEKEKVEIEKNNTKYIASEDMEDWKKIQFIFSENFCKT